MIWILHYSSDEQIIQMVTDIKFAIMNLLIGSSEEHLSCFDCNWQINARSDILSGNFVVIYIKI